MRRVHQRYNDPAYTDFDAPAFSTDDERALQNYLNEVYSVANIVWDVELLEDVEVDYDLNHNGKLDNNITESLEMLPNGNDPEKHHVLFLVNGIKDSDGFAWNPGRFAWVGNYRANSERPKRAIAHELGHNLGLHHPFDYDDKLGIPNDYDPENIMNYTEYSKLRFQQWVIINTL